MTNEPRKAAAAPRPNAAGAAARAGRPLGLCILSRENARVERWRRLFAAQGWPTDAANDCDEVVRLAEGYRGGIAIVDITLLRTGRLAELKSRAPHLLWIVTGTKGPLDGPEAARCLDEGAEDYVPAGFDERILVAKLRCHVRRLLPRFASEPEQIQDPRGTLRLDRGARRFSTRNSKGDWSAHNSLTDLETRILGFFILRTDLVLETRAILEGVWLDRADQVNPETVGRHVELLRKKLGAAGKRIENIYGRGYIFRGE